MELDSKKLGRLRRVANPRDVWTSESGDFTPWLAENIDVLADELGMTLTITGTEVPVGEFRLDIRAEDGDGQVVVIENQLERTDHSHLGQCLVYASGLDASSIIWVAPRFRDEFRQALDWLNERTDLGINFFGVEVGVVQIGHEGPRAPVFDVVARPNDWQKAVKSAGTTAITGGASVSPLNARRQDLFGEILEQIVAAEPSIRMPTQGRGNWLSFASGPFGTWCLTVTNDDELRVEAYLDTQDKVTTERLFDEFQSRSGAIEDAVGCSLSWERLDDKRASRIAAYRPLVIDDEADCAESRVWAAATFASLYSELNLPLRSRAKQLRTEASAAEEIARAAAHESGDNFVEKPPSTSDNHGPS